MSFDVGDRVVCTGDYDGRELDGRHGVVIENDGSFLQVRLDPPIEADHQATWWIPPDQLREEITPVEQESSHLAVGLGTWEPRL